MHNFVLYTKYNKDKKSGGPDIFRDYMDNEGERIELCPIIMNG